MNSIAFMDVIEAEDKNAKETSELYKKEFENFEHFFNLLSETFGYLLGLLRRKKIKKIEQRICLIKLMPRIFQTMQSIRVLFSKGYYYDTRVLERSLGETIGKCTYFVDNEKEAKKWLRSRNKLNISNNDLVKHPFKFLASRGGGYPENLSGLYRELSDYVHSGSAALSLFTYENAGSKVYLDTVPRFKRERFIPFGSYPLFVLIVLRELFKEELRDWTS